MQKILIAGGLMMVATASFAETYAGLAFQAGSAKVERGDLRTPRVDSRTVDLASSEGGSALRFIAGHHFTDRWALEFSVHRTGIEQGIEQRLDATREEEWEVSLNGTHFTLAPVWSHPLGENLSLRLTAGLVYGDYDIERTHLIDVENGPDVTLSRVRTGDSDFGALLGVGASYSTPWKIDIIAELQHQRTGLLSNSFVSVGAVYRF